MGDLIRSIDLHHRQIAVTETGFLRLARTMGFAALLTLAAAFTPRLLMADTATLVADTYTNSGAPTANYGTKKPLVVQGPPSSSSVDTAYLQFDLSTLPAGTTGSDVAKATLTLGISKVVKSGTFDVFRVLGSPGAWTEATLTADSAPPLATDPDVSGVTVGATDKNTFRTIDITGLVQDWLNNSLPNNGVALVPSGAGVSVWFDSKEATATSHWARLDISLGTVPNFSGSLSGDVTGTQTATHVTSINGAAVGSLSGATNGQILTFNGSNWSPSSVVSSLTASSGIVPITNGGTGSSTASGARSNLGAAASGANSDITSLSGITGNIALPESTSSAAGNVTKGGWSFIHSYPPSSYNTFIGKGAGNFSMTGTGDTGIGWWALSASTTGGSNTAVGVNALAANTVANNNTAVGVGALAACVSGDNNTAVGTVAANHTTAEFNVALGQAALFANTTGGSNTAIGNQALVNNTTAGGNTAVGGGALFANTTGTNNTAIGAGAGSSLTTGNNNIDIGNVGVAAESNAIRIGTSGTQTATYIAGISGATSSSGIAVYINSSGQLGTATSSARFKTNIEDMGDSTSKLMQLRPVRFHYKQDIDPSGLEQYGLVAEEVAKVYPDLVVYDDKGQAQTVRYHFINAMLLNEVQKQAREIEVQRKQIEALTARLNRLEAHTGAIKITAAAGL